jgi:hypothetical protein
MGGFAFGAPMICESRTKPVKGNWSAYMIASPK